MISFGELGGLVLIAGLIWFAVQLGLRRVIRRHRFFRRREFREIFGFWPEEKGHVPQGHIAQGIVDRVLTFWSEENLLAEKRVEVLLHPYKAGFPKRHFPTDPWGERIAAKWYGPRQGSSLHGLLWCPGTGRGIFVRGQAQTRGLPTVRFADSGAGRGNPRRQRSSHATVLPSLGDGNLREPTLSYVHYRPVSSKFAQRIQFHKRSLKPKCSISTRAFSIPRKEKYQKKERYQKYQREGTKSIKSEIL